MSFRTLLRRGLLAGVASVALTTACGDDDPSAPANDEVIFRWTFPDDLDGWDTGMDDAGGWGTAVHSGADALASPTAAEEGSVKLDGVGDPGEPNAWIFRTDVVLPDDATTLAYWAAGHNQDGANAHLRVRLVDESATNHTLADWEEFSGTAGTRNWEERMVSVAAFAGQTVALYFEQDDNGPGAHEQIYLDEIRVLRD